MIKIFETYFSREDCENLLQRGVSPMRFETRLGICSKVSLKAQLNEGKGRAGL